MAVRHPRFLETILQDVPRGEHRAASSPTAGGGWAGFVGPMFRGICTLASEGRRGGDRVEVDLPTRAVVLPQAARAAAGMAGTGGR